MSEGQYYNYRQLFDLLNVHIAWFIFALHKEEYHIGKIFSTQKHLEQLQNDVQPEYVYIHTHIYIYI